MKSVDSLLEKFKAHQNGLITSLKLYKVEIIAWMGESWADVDRHVLNVPKKFICFTDSTTRHRSKSVNVQKSKWSIRIKARVSHQNWFKSIFEEFQVCWSWEAYHTRDGPYKFAYELDTFRAVESSVVARPSLSDRIHLDRAYTVRCDDVHCYDREGAARQHHLIQSDDGDMAVVCDAVWYSMESLLAECSLLVPFDGCYYFVVADLSATHCQLSLAACYCWPLSRSTRRNSCCCCYWANLHWERWCHCHLQSLVSTNWCWVAASLAFVRPDEPSWDLAWRSHESTMKLYFLFLFELMYEIHSRFFPLPLWVWEKTVFFASAYVRALESLDSRKKSMFLIWLRKLTSHGAPMLCGAAGYCGAVNTQTLESTSDSLFLFHYEISLQIRLSNCSLVQKMNDGTPCRYLIVEREIVIWCQMSTMMWDK